LAGELPLVGPDQEERLHGSADQSLCVCTCTRALTAWYSDRAGWADLVARGMSQDWSWEGEPCLDYIELYYRALKP
jgi:glycogen synthase